MRLDYYDILPEGMEAYLSHNGWHFNKKMAEWAISQMRDQNGNKLSLHSKEEVEGALAANNVSLNNAKGYDAVYVYHMGLADHYGGSIISDTGLAKYVKEYIDDKDGYDGIAFTRFYADCNGKGMPIIWEDMI